MINKKRLVILIILSIFVIGMVLAPASASHTFKAGKYKGTISDKKYNSLKKKAKKGKAVEYIFKTKHYKTYKKPKYKTKKVTKKKWKYKKVKYSEYWVWDDGSEWKNYNTYIKYINKGWTHYGSSSKEKYYDDGSYHSINYAKLKKKVKVTTKKKVKVGTKKVKKPVYMSVGNMDISGEPIDKKISVLCVYTDYGIINV